MDNRMLICVVCLFKLTRFKVSKKKRLQHCLMVSNIQLRNFVFGKSAQTIPDTFFGLDPSFMKKKHPELHAGIDTHHIETNQ